METLLAILVGVILACAVHLLLSRDLFRVIGAMLSTSGANLAVIVVGRVRRAVPAFVPPGAEQVGVEQVGNPLPQAFVLTAIGHRLRALRVRPRADCADRAQLGTLDVDAQREAEPPPDDRSERATKASRP